MRLKMLRVLPAALAVSVSASVFADSQVATSDVAVLRPPTRSAVKRIVYSRFKRTVTPKHLVQTALRTPRSSRAV